jgi:hypothetical protein
VGLTFREKIPSLNSKILIPDIGSLRRCIIKSIVESIGIPISQRLRSKDLITVCPSCSIAQSQTISMYKSSIQEGENSDAEEYKIFHGKNYLRFEAPVAVENPSFWEGVIGAH